MALDIMAAFTNEPPELDFIWPGFLAGTVGALVAPGATGKSFFALEAAMSIACSVAGGDLVGLTPAHTGRVVYLAGEDPQPALVRRVHAIGQHLNQSAREAIAENLMLEPIMGKRLNVMDEAHLRRVIDYSAGARLAVLKHPAWPFPWQRQWGAYRHPSAPCMGKGGVGRSIEEGAITATGSVACCAG